MATETLYLRADEIKPGDILPDVSRFPVSDIGVLGEGDPIRIFFAGTGFTKAVRPFPYAGESRYPAFRVERSPDCTHARVAGDDSVPANYSCDDCGHTWVGSAL